MPQTAVITDLIEELRWRGLFHQATDETALREHLSDPGGARRKVYIGFDPTADSLTIGNLVPIMLLVHVARAGHEPVVVMGGGTGLIGDPSGKSAERQLLTDEIVRGNVESQRRIFSGVFSNAGLSEPRIVNNADWLTGLGYIEVLRDVGKHFSINMMVQKESVRERLNNREQGISYTEFSYMILQSYDYWRLFSDDGVTVQMGGSDQWGNIVAGADLIRKISASQGVDAPHVFGLTAPLVTKSDGGKFGKSESGAVWLTAERTSAYAMYQFWLNAADDDALRWLKVFTLLDQATIAAIERAHLEDPGKREAQRALALEATALVHGREQAEHAVSASKALFSGDIASLPESMLDEVFGEAPSSEHDRAQLDGEGVSFVDLLVETGLAESKKKSREFLSAGSVAVNGAKVGLDDRLTPGMLLHGNVAAIRRGKKTWHVTRWR